VKAPTRFGAKNALLCFPVNRMVATTPAELFRFQTLGVLLLVFRHGIVAFFAVVALQGDNVAHRSPSF
jgi:hypothetical protein